MKPTRHLMLAALAAIGMAGLTATATNPSELRIYINPGHGSWTGGDRALPTVKHGPYNASNPDTTGFFESNTNLRKGFGLLDKLRDYGLTFDPTLNQDNPNPARRGAALDLSQNIVMSHVKCGPYPLTDTQYANAYNRGLSEISTEVDLNNFDMFISVHSNATTEGSSYNFPAFFYRGENGTPSVPGSNEVAAACWPYIYKLDHNQWSHYSLTNPDICADIDFWSGDYATTTINGVTYKGYYGVLRHGVMGFLVEGYFHTYQPARHRAMNFDVDRNEGEAYARGIADYFGLQKESTGDIYGIVRDKHERFRHQYYNCPATSEDALMPINGATVKLLRDGQVIRTYTTDDEWNGAFVFDRLEPGDYYLEVTHPEYYPAAENFCGPITVRAAENTLPRVYLENLSYEPEAVVYTDYPDPVTSPAFHAAAAYTFKSAADVQVAQLEGKKVRRMIAHGNHIYVLALDAENQPTLLVLSAADLTVLAEVSTVGTEGTEKPIGDIAVTSDGHLVACAEELCHFDDNEVWEGETRGECNFYTWTVGDNGLPTGDPIVWFTTQRSGNWYHAVTGTTMAYTGTFQEGRILVSSFSTWYNRKVRNVIIDIYEGQMSNDQTFTQPNTDIFNMDDLGDDFTYTLSPLSSDYVIVNSDKLQPFSIGINSVADITRPAGALTDIDKREAGAAFFKFAGHSMMATPTVDADGACTGVALYDITTGINHATEVALTNASIEAVEGASAAVGRALVTIDNNDKMSDADVDLYLLSGNRIVRLTTLDVEQPIVRGNFAYDLTAETNSQGDITVNFSLITDATAHIELTAEADGKLVVCPTEQFEAGANTYTIPSNIRATLDGKYAWSVVVDNDPVPAVGRIFTAASNNCRGVTVDRNPESPFFGQVYMPDPYSSPKGLYVYTPALQLTNTTPYGNSVFSRGNTASPYRVSMLPSGRVMAADWSDANAGIWVFDPASPDGEITNIFNGSLNTATGEIRVDGKVIAGGSTGQWVYTDAQGQTWLYAFIEDYPQVNGNKLVRYALPADEVITTAPESVYNAASVLMPNTNVNVVATDQCVMVSQTRSSGNNSEGAPSFILMSHDGDILFNSGSDLRSLDGSDGGMALSDDGTMMAVGGSSSSGLVHIYNVTWGEEIEFTELYSFSIGDFGSLNIYQLEFDPAGNLLVGCRSGLRAYTLPREATKVATPAAASQAIDAKIPDAVSDVTVEASTAADVYYNLQGQRIDASSLVPGVYIRVNGQEATKVVVK